MKDANSVPKETVDQIKNKMKIELENMKKRNK